MIAFLLAGAHALAEQEYFTWVDAQGRVHNSPKPSSDKKSPAPKTAEEAAPIKRGDYQTEEEFEQAEAKFKKDNPPFFTWIDGEGRLRSERVPDGKVDVETIESELVTDHTLLPPERITNELDDFECCQQYAHNVNEQLKPQKGVMLNRPHLASLLKTPDGHFHAWFIRAPSYVLNTDNPPHLRLRLRESDDELGVLALDKNLQPLHLLPQLLRQYREQTWKSIAMYETLIGISDADVYAFIIYFPANASAKTTLEVEWRP